MHICLRRTKDFLLSRRLDDGIVWKTRLGKLVLLQMNIKPETVENKCVRPPKK